jgi:hypothetical protein
MQSLCHPQIMQSLSHLTTGTRQSPCHLQKTQSLIHLKADTRQSFGHPQTMKSLNHSITGTRQSLCYLQAKQSLSHSFTDTRQSCHPHENQLLLFIYRHKAVTLSPIENAVTQSFNHRYEAVILSRTAPICVITQRAIVISYWRFGITNQSHPQGSFIHRHTAPRRSHTSCSSIHRGIGHTRHSKQVLLDEMHSFTFIFQLTPTHHTWNLFTVLCYVHILRLMTNCKTTSLTASLFVWKLKYFS